MPMLALLFAVAALLPPQVRDDAWVEGESPTSANAKVDVASCNYPQLLSQGRWLTFSKKKVDAPAGGLVLTYTLPPVSGGVYEGHARVGFEWVRSPLEWRIGDGGWTKVGADVATHDPVRLATWMEAGWLDLGKAELKPGANTLQIRYTDANSNGDILAALDAIAFTRPGIELEGRLKPGEEYDEAIDREARAKRFALPDETGRRWQVTLDGLWQVARWDDPDMDRDRYEPIRSLPSSTLRWQGIQVPEDAWSKPELTFASRLLYRTTVSIPKGRDSFFLHFSGTTWIVSVFVNGQFLGWHKGTLVPWDIDITKAIRSGEANDIVVAVKGPYYAMDTKDLTRQRNLPREEGFLRFAHWVAPIYPSSKGEEDGTKVGLVNPVTLVASGPVYVSDAFVRPDVRDRRLDAEISLANPGAAERTVTVSPVAIEERSGSVGKRLPAKVVVVPAGGTTTVRVGDTWPDPKLWWPVRNPSLYRLRTTVTENSVPIDTHDQTFGFRDIGTDGRKILVNGVARNFWNWVTVSGDPKTPEEWLAGWSSQGDRFHRFARDHVVPGVPTNREAQLDWFDHAGVPGRLSTCIDGMIISYDLNNPLVWQNFREHLEQVARAYRNHPSVVVYSAENELLYINAQNLGLADMAEPKMKAIIDAASAIDPTRPFMVDGGGAMTGNLLPIDCPHYPEGETEYEPESAFTGLAYADHSKRWPWDRQRPQIIGETFFYAGKLEDQAWIGGDDVFRGRQFADVGAARYARLLIEGARWKEVAGICPWVEPARVPGADKAFSALAAFTRKQGIRLPAGKAVDVAVKVFNDTFSDKPLKFVWMLVADGKPLASGGETLSVRPGYSAERAVHILAPRVTARRQASLVLRVSQEGAQPFEDAKPVSILPEVGAVEASVPVLVFDRGKRVGEWLTQHRVAWKPIGSVSDLSRARGLLLVGPDALGPTEAYGPALMAYAARGNPVIALEQNTPLAGAGLPTPVRSTEKVGGFAFCQAPTLPVFRNLGTNDLVDWAGDFPTFKDAYQKPSGNARSLIQGGEGLNNSLLLEVPTGKGVMVLCQMRVGSKLGIEPAADRLLANLIESYSSYHPAFGRIAVFANPDRPLARAVRSTGVLTDGGGSMSKLLDAKAHVALVVDGTSPNLEALLQSKSRVDSFVRSGRWIMVCGLRPDGLSRFRSLTGVDDPIRPFRVERVTLEHPEHPLAATLGNRDFALYSPQEIMFGDYWLSDRMYRYVVGANDAAPFMKMPDGPEDPLEYKPTYSDNDPFNLVNGLLNSDTWRAIRQLWVPETGNLTLSFGLRRPEKIAKIVVWNNVNYSTIENMDIVFDGDAASALHVVLPDNDRMSDIRLPQPIEVRKSIAFVVESWRHPFKVSDGKTLRLVGLDDVQFVRASTPTGKVSLDNVGGLVAYPVGKGGFLLNQLDFQPGDPNPENDAKKLRLMTTLLKNIGAGSADVPVVVPGTASDYHPIDITRWNNGYVRNRPGQNDLFGEGDDLSQLVPGERFYAEVPYRVSNYVNAPVPQAIFVGKGHPDVKGVEIGRSVDALYFLHLARVWRPVQDWERSAMGDTPPELARYVVHYADGTSAEVSVRLGEEVADWRRSPQPLPNGQIAWSVGSGDSARTVYATVWPNPKPAIPVLSVDVVAGKDQDRGTVVLLGMTTAKTKVH